MKIAADRERSVELIYDVRLLLLLFISFRFMLFIAYQPVLTDSGEAGISLGGDRLFHYRLAELSEHGLLPFRDWWSEFPPLWYGITTSVYLLLGDAVNYGSWSLILGLIMLTAETGNLLLLRAIGEIVYGERTGMQLAWVYGLVAAPAIFMWWNFDAMMNFTILLGIYCFLKRRMMMSAFVIGIGILLKFLPALLFGAVLRYSRRAQSCRFIGVAIATAALVYVPLLMLNGELTFVSLRAQFDKPSSQTIWALVDGNHTTGNIAGVKDRLEPYGYALPTDSKPARIPAWLRLTLALAIGAIVYRRTRRRDDQGLLAFAGVTVLIFYLQAQAWSPQWISLIVPLTLLIYPTRRGVLATVVLSIVVLAEYPLLWIRTGDLDPPGAMGGALFGPWLLLLLLRTCLLAALAIAFYRRLRQIPTPDEDR